jgi:hypothetical protein
VSRSRTLLAHDDRQSAGDRRRLVATDVLQPAHVPLDIRAFGRHRIKVLTGAPSQEDVQVVLGVLSGRSPVAVEVGSDGGTHDNTVRRTDARIGSSEGSHGSR